MNTGKMRNRVTIQSKDKDAAGRPVNAWTDVCTVFAARAPVKGRQITVPTAVNDELILRYEIRYRTDITPDMRLVDRGRNYQIIAVMDDVKGDRTETHLMTKEVRDG